MRRLYILVLAIVAVAAVLVVVFHRDREPEYGGKRLSEWVDVKASLKDRDARAEAEDAIRRIGTNAVPWLVKTISYEPSALKSKFHERLNSGWEKTQERSEKRGVQSRGLERMLGPWVASASKSAPKG